MDPLIEKLYLATKLVEPPAGHVRVTQRADVELAERADAIATGEGVPYGAAMHLAIERDPKLKLRYYDHTLGLDPRVELAERAGELCVSEPQIALMSAAIRVLSSDRELADRIEAYFVPDKT